MMATDRRFLSLSIKFQAPIVVLTIIAGVATSYFLFQEVKRSTHEQMRASLATLHENHRVAEQALLDALRSKGLMLGRFMSRTVPDFIVTYDTISLLEFQKEAMQDKEIAYVAYLNPDHSPITPYRKPENVDVIEQTFPIFLGEEVLGYIVIGLSKTIVNEKSRQHLARTDRLVEEVEQFSSAAIAQMRVKVILTIVALALIVTSVVYFMFKSMVFQPLLKLQHSAVRLGEGRLDERVDAMHHDEIGVVANAFNEMAEALNQTTVSKEYFENIIGSMGEALFVLNPDGVIEQVNYACQRLLGYPPDQIRGRHINDFVDEPDFFQKFQRDYSREIETLSDRETMLKTRDGTTIPVSMTCSRLTQRDGTATGTVLVATDIRERLRAQKIVENKNRELEKINNQLDQFAYVVSHDLKAPLRAITNLSSWIEEDLDEHLEGETRQQMNLLRGRVQRMEALINGILEYSRIGRIEAKIKTVDINEMLTEIIDGMPVPDGFTITVHGEMPTLKTAAVPLSQVFANLISNAIKYRRCDDGHIDIRVADLGDSYQFSVSDDGPGIDPRFHEKVFMIFQTLEARDVIDSTGVGLSLVKKIVEDQGGAIELESAEGQGATFRFTWPKRCRTSKAA